MKADELIGYGIIFGLPLLILFFRWLWQNPRVNMEKLKQRLAEANDLKERLAMADELLQDLDLQSMESANIVLKNVTLSWTDNCSGINKEITFFVDGKNETTKQLQFLAKTIRQETSRDLMKIIYKLPKRHNKNQPSNVITVYDQD